MTLEELLSLKESEDKIEFKEAKNNFKYAGGDNREPKDRRHCVLGYVIAFCNEGGGLLVLGVSDKLPHTVVGTNFAQGKEGELVDKIYSDIGIRVQTTVLNDKGKRVLVLHIPARPVGKAMKFESVALMRTGESLREMSDQEMFSILSEQEPDFSAKVCEGLKINDIDKKAFEKMKSAYAIKQKNNNFLRLSKEQVLIDLGLLYRGSLNFAALLLLGNEEAIQRLLPQARIVWEFRFFDSQIHFDFRESITKPLFVGIDEIWQLVNNKNADIPIQNGAYITRLSTFNEIVIREAVLNAIAHRDYTITSEVLIKQYPKKIIISNPGGFPKGVTIDNILTINSTPRSRLMAEVLEKTGLVERSGQGVDKIYSITLSEGKPEPDYGDSNLFQVILKLNGEIRDKAFSIYINDLQSKRAENQKLSVEEILTLHKVKSGAFTQLKQDALNRLIKEGLVIRSSGHTKRYSLTDDYATIASKEQRIGSRYIIIELEQLLISIQGKELRIGDLENDLSGILNRNQIRYLISKLLEDKVLLSKGQGRGTKYALHTSLKNSTGDELVNTVIQNLRKKHI